MVDEAEGAARCIDVFPIAGGQPMIGGTRGRTVTKALLFAAIAVGASASFAFDSFHHLQAGGKSPAAVLPADEKPKFLAYVKGQRPLPRSLSRRVSVGDVLPDSGLLYYDIPLSYGLGLYRFTVVDGVPVIVDPTTSRAVEVIE
jgi:hypothetical protein